MRDQLVYMAKLAEQTERFDDMIAFMKQVIDQNSDLDEKERNLFSIAYKNQVAPIRTALRAIFSYEQKETQNGHHQIDVIQFYHNNLLKDLQNNCNECLKIVQSLINQSNSNHEVNYFYQAFVFYQKMKGDYLRYLSEFETVDSTKSNYISEADQAYEVALEKAKSNLKSTNQLRLGVALNQSVFYYEIMNDIHRAINVSKTAFNEAIAELDNLQEENYKDITTIMQLIKDNMTNWQQELQDVPIFIQNGFDKQDQKN